MENLGNNLISDENNEYKIKIEIDPDESFFPIEIKTKSNELLDDNRLKNMKKEYFINSEIDIKSESSEYENVETLKVETWTLEAPKYENNLETSEYLSEKLHERTHTTDKLFKCKICFRAFSRVLNLSQHERSHAKKSLHCNACSKTFRHLNNLKKHELRHMRRITEPPLKPYKCNVCSKRFILLKNLQFHSTNGACGRVYRCDECPRTFQFSIYLKRHKMVHTKVYPYQCSVCAKPCTSLTDLKLHEKCHMPAKPYQCKVCFRRFGLSNDLELHMRCHTNQSHKCSKCSKTFVRLYGLNHHERTVHNNEKPYQCDMCSKIFDFASILELHKRIHTGDIVIDDANIKLIESLIKA